MSETTETGPMLGEDARDELAELLLEAYVATTQSGARQAANYILDTLLPHVAALVTEAERRGEGRGAQAERERITSKILELASTPSVDTAALFPAWLRSELRSLAAHIARGCVVTGPETGQT